MKIIGAIVAIVFLGALLLPSSYDSFLSRLVASLELGGTSYPTSLDSFTNPAPGDSVKTLSHSGQHGDANDAIEALEAKLGIGASTPINGTVLFGNGTGSSAWSASPSITSLITQSFISQASSTILSGLTISGNATTTGGATTTNLAVTSSATTTSLFGAGLVPCSGQSFLQYSVNGKFSCGAASLQGLTITSTSTPNSANNFTISTTTTMTIGERAITWFSCDQAEAGGTTFTLNVKPSGVATSTLDAIVSQSTEVALKVPLMGVYTSTIAGDVEFYLGDQNLNYRGCARPSVILIKAN
jgi:hypothetical protein